MPLYEYECNACRVRVEVRGRVTDEPISVCPSCGGSLRRVIHPVGIIFKGSGFYSTDNRKTDSGVTTAGDTPSGDKAGEAKTPADGAKKSESGKSDSGKSDSGKTSTAAKEASSSANVS